MCHYNISDATYHVNKENTYQQKDQGEKVMCGSCPVNDIGWFEQRVANIIFNAAHFEPHEPHS